MMNIGRIVDMAMLQATRCAKICCAKSWRRWCAMESSPPQTHATNPSRKGTSTSSHGSPSCSHSLFGGWIPHVSGKQANMHPWARICLLTRVHLNTQASGSRICRPSSTRCWRPSVRTWPSLQNLHRAQPCAYLVTSLRIGCEAMGCGL